VPPAHFNEAQAEQALWQEFRDHGASLSNALNEALRIHGVLRGGSSKYAFFCWIWSFSAPPPLVTPAFVLFLTFLTQFLPRLA
jgi:hypothetical protein